MNIPKYVPDEPIVAIATALVPSALGIVRVSGRNCVELLSSVFSRPVALKNAEGNTILHGWILEKNEKIDEVLISVFRSPKSFTGEEMAEISCHGGVSIVQKVYSILLNAGFRAAERGEFTFRAFVHGKTDLTRAEAVREIIDAKTDRASFRAATRLSGGLFEEIERVRALIVETIADIQAEIEYPEDENAIADSFNPQKIVRAEKILRELESSWKSEKIYQDGAKIVLAGKTNAGKSSLFNALLKEERAIVSDIAGTTRDFLESWVNFDGIPARLFDTAGLRKTDDEIERRGVVLSKNLSQNADLVLYLVDAKMGICAEDEKFILDFLNENPQKIPLILVFTKNDLVSSIPNISFDCKIVSISARTGNGILELCACVKNALLNGESVETRFSLGSERQKNAVSEALERIRHALSLPADFGMDAVAQDLEDALDALSSVTGETTPDDILESVFSRFCVGK